jgi:hypothetical protein
LEEDLAATRKRWKIAFLHRSPYGSSRHGGDERVREDQEPVFARHKVDVVFAGHDHVYEPTVPIRGVTYVVSGGGGRRLYRVGKGKHTAPSAPKHHAILARVDGGCLSLEAVEPGGVRSWTARISRNRNLDVAPSVGADRRPLLRARQAARAPGA